MSIKLSHRPLSLIKHLYKSSILIVFLFAFSTIVFSNNTPNTVPSAQGFADSFSLDGNEVTVQGWVGSVNHNDEIKSISIWLGSTKIYDGDFERFDRPDVAKATSRKDWITSGWRIGLRIPKSLKDGEYPIRVLALTEKGGAGELSINSHIQKINYIAPSTTIEAKTYAFKLLILSIAILVTTIFFKAESISKKIEKFLKIKTKAPFVFCFSLVFSFFVLLGFGVSGSSFGLGLKQNQFITADLFKFFGDEQPVRGDEWRVLTPNIIAQKNHTPPFPIINKNLGDDGQNMLIVGMTGVPVAHLSAIAKPATWGFFIFDLKRALSWNWLFPIFSCLLALWGVISTLKPGAWKTSFIVSLCFTSTAYVVAWSNWPAYTVLFPCLVYLSAISILKTQNTINTALLAIILGVSFAGFVLVLYPPWQISLTYLFIALAAGSIIKEKLYKHLSPLKFFALFIALVISTAILYSWWIDAHLAIEKMQETIYPGQRTTITGGTINLPFLLRGFTNLATLQRLDSLHSNQSEIASFYYMLLPLAVLFLIRFSQKKITAIELSLGITILFILLFMFVGIPAQIADITLWGRVPANRADIALGLASIILSGLLSTPTNEHDRPQKHLALIALATSICWSFIVYINVFKLHNSIVTGFTFGAQIIVFFTITLAGYFLVRGKVRIYLTLMLGLTLITTIRFHPIVITPSYVNANLPKGETTASSASDETVLTLETAVPAMFIFSTGIKVVNGVFYYPQDTLWSQLDPTRNSANIYNRYQHLTFSANKSNNSLESYYLETPFLDQVNISINLESFDFSRTSASLVLAPDSDSLLKNNKSLMYLKEENGWMWFRVNK